MNGHKDAILEIRNLNKVFKGDLFRKKQTAINNVSCRFLRGKCTGLLGHNGAGKTTTIRSIFGLIRPTSGEILFNGGPITTAIKARIGYMPEVNKLPTNLSCEEILRSHMSIYMPHLSRKALTAKVAESLRHVGLLDARNKRVKVLSKGMGRRIAWAQATIHDPDLVILDEPFTGLDPVATSDLLGWIKGCKEQGKSLVLCTHDLWAVRELCDDVHVFRKGQLVYSTLDVSAITRTAALNSANYQLVLSGVRESDLKQLAETFRLKPWDYLSQKNLVMRLTFKEYEVASAWLKACIERGLIILRFADEIAVEDDSIKALFEGGQV